MPDISKEQLYIIMAVMVMILIGCAIGVYNQNASGKQTSPLSSPAIQTENKPKKTPQMAIFLHVSGAVAREGIYKMETGDRMIDLLKLSGVLATADLDSINLAEPLSDGEKIYVPKNSGKSTINGQSAEPAKASSGSNAKININLADEKALDGLPGVGPVMAKKIVDYRKANGRFSDIEELKNVPGISEKKYNSLKDRISIY
jgi:competence protein ComEA